MPNPSKHKRAAVYKKCGGHCAYCGKPLSKKEMQVEHVHPKSDAVNYSESGSVNNLSNLLPSCANCNSLKADMSLEKFRKKLAAYLEVLRHYQDVNISGSQEIKFYFELLSSKNSADQQSQRQTSSQTKQTAIRENCLYATGTIEKIKVAPKGGYLENSYIVRIGKTSSKRLKIPAHERVRTCKLARGVFHKGSIPNIGDIVRLCLKPYKANFTWSIFRTPKICEVQMRTQKT